MFKKNVAKKCSLSDRDKLRSLRIMTESTETNYKLGMIPDAEYSDLMLSISKQLKQLEDKYGIK